MVKAQVLKLAILFLVLTIASLWGALETEGNNSNLLFSTFSIFGSVGLGLFLVNFLVDQKSRRIAAAPLSRLVSLPIMSFHNDFIRWGREQFGITSFNAILDEYAANRGDPVALSPEQRDGMDKILDKNSAMIDEYFSLIDERMSDLINVLGWSFDAKIISAALSCKQNIAEFNENHDPTDASSRLKRIEMYLDTDGTSGAVLEHLYAVLGQPLPINSQGT